MGPDAMIFVFWMLSFKPTFSFSSFTFIKRLFSPSSLSVIRVVSSAYLRLLIFLPAILIPACNTTPFEIQKQQRWRKGMAASLCVFPEKPYNGVVPSLCFRTRKSGSNPSSAPYWWNTLDLTALGLSFLEICIKRTVAPSWGLWRLTQSINIKPLE